MAAKKIVSNTPKEKEKNYRSRYDANRHCFRQDKTHYVYQEWVETGKDQGYYVDHVFTVGEDGVTLELLDYLQATDNGEVQDQEDEERNLERLAENMLTFAKSPEEELCDEDEPQSQLVKEFNEKVRPHLSDEQMDFIYDRYGQEETLDEIAEELPPNKDGKPVSRPAVFARQKQIFEKEEKLMNKKHEVNIVVSKSDGREQSDIQTRKCCMREWLI